jgi:hypothetical protein
MNQNQPLARLALGERLAATLGALDLALPPPLFPAALPPKNAQKPQTPTRGDGGSSAGEARPAPALYPPCPLERLRCTTRGAGGGASSPAPRGRPGEGVGLISPERCLSSSHTIPDEPERRNVPLDLCSPAIA